MDHELPQYSVLLAGPVDIGDLRYFLPTEDAELLSEDRRLRPRDEICTGFVTSVLL